MPVGRQLPRKSDAAAAAPAIVFPSWRWLFWTQCAEAKVVRKVLAIFFLFGRNRFASLEVILSWDHFDYE